MYYHKACVLLSTCRISCSGRPRQPAALRGTTLKNLVVAAIEREIVAGGPEAGGRRRRMRLPLVRLGGGRRLDLSEFNFDDLLA